MTSVTLKIIQFSTYAPNPDENGLTTDKHKELAMKASMPFPPILTISAPISEHVFSCVTIPILDGTCVVPNKI